jgi:hypothetical protein
LEIGLFQRRSHQGAAETEGLVAIDRLLRASTVAMNSLTFQTIRTCASMAVAASRA